jgi:hypothetical protein
MARLAPTLRDIGRSVVQIQRTKLSWGLAVRATVGVAIPLIVGQIIGHPLVGVSASVGALQAGFASFQGTYRSRASVVAVTSLGIALSAFVGGTVGHRLGIDIVIVVAWGFSTGMLLAWGQSASVVGVQALVILLVYSQFSFSVLTALREAGFVLAGGLIQLLLIVVIWPFQRFPAERRALADAYASLARLAGVLAATPGADIPPGMFEGLAPIMRDPQPFGRDVEMAAHTALYDLAERVRLELNALARARQRLGDVGLGQAASAMDEVARAAGIQLEAVATALRRAAIPASSEAQRHRLQRAIAAVQGTPSDTGRGASGESATGQSAGGQSATREAAGGLGDLLAAPAWRQVALDEAVRRCQALAGQLRAVTRIAAVPAGGDPVAIEEEVLTGQPDPAPSGRRSHFGIGWVDDRLDVFRANLNPSSQVFRHALRLTVALAIAVGLSHFIALQHRYWLPMTVVLVLRPDFSSTFTRGASRILGTLLGAGVVTVAIAELRPGQLGLTVLVLVWAIGAYTTLQANYAIYSVCIASLVVTLLAFGGQPDTTVALDRCLYTAAGAALALVAYVLWPTWQSTTLADDLADLVATEGRYGTAVLDAWIDPTRADRQALHQARLDARLARSNAEAAASRTVGEPTRSGGSGIPTDRALGVLAAVATCVRALLTLHAELPPEAARLPELADLSHQYARAMATAADVLRTNVHQPVGPVPVPEVARSTWPPLRATQLDLAHALGVGNGSLEGHAQPDSRVLIVVSETDLLVNAVNTLGHLVGLEPAGSGPG